MFVFVNEHAMKYVFQEPQFMTGWSEYFGNDGMIFLVYIYVTQLFFCNPGHAGCSEGMVGEATPAILILILLFITPSRLDFWPFVRRVRIFL